MYIFRIAFYLICFIAVIQTNSQYSVDMIDVEWNISTTNNLDMFWKLTQPTRGVYAMSGFMDVKEDIDTNKAIGKFDIYYSRNDITYILTPFRMLPSILTDSFNDYYKEYLMDSVFKCCENPIHFNGKFVSPLKKRRMICENCLLSSDNFPTHLRLGYYRIVVSVKGITEFALAMTVKVEEE